ncbi:hypothetical protein RRG08_042697 [Elysia crispata]|uniref:Uncharacterized protein n=1 Tax=Elysia crispata TaxID=231223 RepID=A0AAE1CKQ4_9GAST|nr:hypothetical protein RRG08_042697 [Elysia crispata]
MCDMLPWLNRDTHRCSFPVSIQITLFSVPYIDWRELAPGTHRAVIMLSKLGDERDWFTSPRFACTVQQYTNYSAIDACCKRQQGI